MQTPPDEPQAQLRWLVDRAQIGDVLVEYARCADAADWSAMGELFTENGQAVFAAGSFPGRNFGDAAGAVMAVFCGTHHLSTNHAIHIDGDRATTRSYLQAIHLTDPDDNTQHQTWAVGTTTSSSEHPTAGASRASSSHSCGPPARHGRPHQQSTELLVAVSSSDDDNFLVK